MSATSPFNVFSPRSRRKLPLAQSCFRGVFRNRGQWLAKVWFEGKNHHVGWFRTEDEAARAHDRRARVYGVPESKLNFPLEVVSA